MNNMTTAYIGLGSNQGNSKSILKGVMKLLANNENFCMPIASSFYQTSPVGYEDQGDFINAVVKVDTALEPAALLKFLFAIEKACGRTRDVENPNGPRTMDCDLLLYGREEIKTESLQVPHPRMMKRLFVMEPLVEVAPKAYIPGFGYAKEVYEESLKMDLFNSQKATKIEV